LNEHILHKDVQNFIKTTTVALPELAFSGSPFQEVSIRELLQQLESYRKAKDKLPSWYRTDRVYYPPKLNIEQTSSELTAEYKVSLVQGNTMADITGGFGVDSYYFSDKFKTVHHFETDSDLSDIATHNFKQLQKKNILTFNTNGIEGIMNNSYDLVYADPSRRHDTKGKVFYLRDCEPNIPDHLDSILDRCKLLMIKTSPMLDITVGIEELKQVSEIHIIAVKNDVKELIWFLKRDNTETIQIKTVNVTKAGRDYFEFSLNAEANVEFGDPESYLYEPNAAILKSGAFNLIADKFQLKKLHKNTHLYTRDSVVDFPGRIFKIMKTIPYTKKLIRAGITFDKANVATRNFPETVSQLRTKWKILDGGELYVFFTTVSNDKKMMLLCSKI
jgi:hypothetical protein